MTFKDIPFGEPESFNVVAEIPKGSPIKYEYDEASDTIKEDFIFRDGFVFAYNYGYIPQTRGGDGDALDAIILAEEQIPTGTIARCRPIGMIELLDRGQEDNKIIAVRVDDAQAEHLRDITDLTPADLRAFRDFFAGVAKQKNKIVEIKSFAGKKRAIAELQKAVAREQDKI